MSIENEYATKLGLIMEEYIKGNLDMEEYVAELDRLEDWYQENSNVR